MEIELWNGSTKAIIDPQGAWLTNLSDDYGDVLFPKRILLAGDGTKKVRGGCHVCLPNFGPGGISGQPQHGFGRLLTWQVEDQADDTVTLTLVGEGEYDKLVSKLSYQLGDLSLSMTLEMENQSKADLRVAPAFHPYFTTVHDPENVIIGSKMQPLDELEEARFEDGDLQTLEMSQRHITLRSDSLKTWAIWTDRLAPYVCVEPTLAGNAFINNSPSSSEMIAPGKKKKYVFSIEW